MNDDSNEKQSTKLNAPLSLNESYRHFDTLIWQVPSIGMAVGVGVVIGANQLDKPQGWVLSLEHLKGIVLLLGGVLLTALAVALFKYRIFSSATTPIPLPKPPFGQWPSAGSALQLSILLTTGTVLGLSLVQLSGCAALMVLGPLSGFVMWLAAEQYFNKIRSKLNY